MYALDAGGELLLLVVLPVVLAIKNWDTTLKAIKMLLKFVMTSTPKVIKFITPILASDKNKPLN
jgi:hypothetical protein